MSGDFELPTTGVVGLHFKLDAQVEPEDNPSHNNL